MKGVGELSFTRASWEFDCGSSMWSLIEIRQLGEQLHNYSRVNDDSAWKATKHEHSTTNFSIMEFNKAHSPSVAC